MEACVESFPSWIPSVFSRSRTSTGPSLSRPSATLQEPLPRFVRVCLDSFFASVEQQRNPKLKGKPVVVGRSTVLSASHEAILAGIQPNLSVEAALQLCPTAVVLGGDFALYAKYAERLRGLLARDHTKVEDGAHDDFYLDFVGRHQPFLEFRGSLLRLQLEILQQTGLGVSIGAGSTRAIAAIASRLERPRGLTLVVPGTECAFLKQLPANLLPGVSAARAAELAACEVTTIGALARVPRAVLERGFGKFTGSELWNRARGRDATSVSLDEERQSLTRQMTIEGGTQDFEELKRAICYLCERIEIDLNRTREGAKSVSVRIRYEDDYSARQSARIEPYQGGFQNLALRLLCDLFTRPVRVEKIVVSVIPPPASERTPVTYETPAEPPVAVNQ